MNYTKKPEQRIAPVYKHVNMIYLTIHRGCSWVFRS